MTHAAPHKSRTARTYDLLRSLVIDARYLPGEKLRIDHLSRELGVSSGAVREALSRLTADGLVIAEPQKGFVIAPISRRDLEELTQVRVDVENKCLADAIAHGDLEWEGRVLSAHHRLNAIGEGYRQIGSDEAKRWHALHEEFHDQITSACRNRWWLRLRRQLYVQSERYRRLSGPVDVGERDIRQEHAEIADAVLARDSALATERMRRHLETTTAILLGSSIPFSEE